jgi:hypothetical protein
MHHDQIDPSDQPTLASLISRARDRREFLRALGLGGAALCVPAFLAGCSSDDSGHPLSPTSAAVLSAQGSMATPSVTLDFSTDYGVLNFAYALEQLEAAFYTRVTTAPPPDMDEHERNVLSQIQSHEVIHATFLKTALGAKGIPPLTPNFSAVNFNSRDSVLDTARTFEDLGVAAYNGAAQYIRSATYLTVAGKIVSVEARHAAAIRDLPQPRSGAFAGNDVVNANGLDRAFNPATVLQDAGPFIVNSISIINLPATTA